MDNSRQKCARVFLSGVTQAGVWATARNEDKLEITERSRGDQARQGEVDDEEGTAPRSDQDEHRHRRRKADEPKGASRAKECR